MIEEYERLFFEANTDLISEFDSRIKTFKNTRDMLGKIESTIGMPAWIRFNVGSLAMDIVNFSEIFLDQYKIEIKRDAAGSHTLNLKFNIIRPPVNTTKELPMESAKVDDNLLLPTPIITTLYKAYFFFIRSYQDAIYKFLLCLQEQKAGSYSSMKDAIDEKKNTFKTSNIVGKYLHKYLQSHEYVSWFLDFREKRNRIKYGVQEAYSAKDYQPSLILCEVRDNDRGAHIISDISKRFGLKELSECILWSDKITKAAEELSNEKMDSVI